MVDGDWGMSHCPQRLQGLVVMMVLSDIMDQTNNMSTQTLSNNASVPWSASDQ